jgi:hypothetical protein
VLHNPFYRQKYELNLKQIFPSIPFYKDFYQLADWGKQLINCHINYETIKPKTNTMKAVIFYVTFLFTLLNLDLSLFAQTPPTRTISFADCAWYVKSGYWGPGPNHFSDSDQSVWLDELGRLHLKIRQQGNTWYCTEVYTTEFTSYGEHRFLVDGRIDLLDRNIVLGLFTYASDASEIDIEFSRWGDPNFARVGSFTVQPWDIPGNCERFICHLDSAKTTHYFNWQPDSVTFASLHGHYLGDPPAPNYYIHRWTYKGKDIPSSANNLRTHINYWLNRGDRPLDPRALEIIITHVVQPLSQSVPKNDPPPQQFNLLQNYPNPFAGTTTIHYWLPQPEPVRIDIFNLSGQPVTTLINNDYLSDHHQLEFNAENLPAGIYFYRIQGATFQQTQKMILIR